MPTNHATATVLSVALIAAAGIVSNACSGDDSEDGDAGAGTSMSGTTASGGSMGGGGSPSGGSPSGGSQTGEFLWYNSCGDPVCGPDEPDPMPDNACVDQMLGEPCQEGAMSCDPGVGCGVMLVCADSDPTMGPGGCPISRAAYKRDIFYLNDSGLEALSQQLLALKLATYTYIDDPKATPQLGFILEDVEPSVIADSERDRVNLYAYTSLAVAAIQQQHKQLEEQARLIDELKSQLDALGARVRRLASAESPTVRPH